MLRSKKSLLFFVFIAFFVFSLSLAYGEEDLTKVPLLSALNNTNPHEAKAFYYWMRGEEDQALKYFTDTLLDERLSEKDRLFAWDMLEDIYSRRGNFEKLFDLGKSVVENLTPSSLLYEEITYTLYYISVKQGKYTLGDELKKKLGFITTWSFIGPFDNTGMSGIYKDFPPEKEINFEKIYSGKEDIEVKWFTPSIFPRYGYVNLKSLFYPSYSALAYALTYIYIPIEGEYTIGIGADDIVTLWINDQEILNETTPRKVAFDQYRVKCVLPKGWNKVLLKIGQDDGAWGFYFRITEGGKPVSGIKVSPQPHNLYNKNFVIKVEKEEWNSITNNDNHPWKDFRDAYLLFSKYFLDDAKRLFKGIGDSIGSPLAYYFLGLTELQDKLTDEAFQAFRKAKKCSYFLFPSMEIGKMKLKKGLYDEAIQIFKKLLSKAPNNYIVHTLLGWTYEKRGWDKEAKEELDKVIALYPNYIFPRYLLALMYDGNGWTEDAISEYKTILNIDVTHEGAFSSLLDLYISIRDEKNAVELLKNQLSVYPADTTLYLKFAACYETFKEFDEAIDVLKRALSVTLYYPLIYKELGLIYHGKGNDKIAFDYFNKALELDPALLSLKDYIKFLKNKNYMEDVDVAALIKAAPGREEYPEADAIILLDRARKIVYPDGTTTTYYHEIVKILTVRGREKYGEFFIPYSLGGQRVKILKARTFKPDGDIIEATSIKDLKPMEGYHLYSNVAQKVISLPAVVPGATIEIYYSIDDLGREVTGKNFQDTFYFQSFDPILDSVYILELPKNKKFRYKTVRIDIKPEIKEKYDDIVYTWEVKDIPQILSEPSMPPYKEIAPYLFVTSYKSWKEISDWVWGISEPQAKAGDELKKKVMELIKDANTRMEKIERIYTYVITDIRYVGLEFGISGFMPHKADDVFRYKYGDCKDKATLMKAMLKVAGIDSYLTLVRTRELGHLDKDMPGLEFNHAILAVKNDKGEYMFLDGTAEDVPFGRLPGSDQGAEAMIVTKDGPVFKEIPLDSYEANGKIRNMNVSISNEGKIDAKVHVDLKGYFGSYYRAILKSLGKIKRKEIVERSLGALCPGAKLKDFKFSDLSDLSVPVTQDYTFYSDMYLKKTDDGYSFYPSILERLTSGEEVAKPERRYPIVKYLPYETIDIIRYRLSDGLEWEEIPQDVYIDTPFGTYSLTFELKDGILTFKRVYISKRIWIGTEEYKKYKDFIETVIEEDKKELKIRIKKE